MKEAGLPVADISARYEHFVSTDAALTAEQQQQLTQLLDYGTPSTADAPAKSVSLLVIPRLGTISPWASKATDIAHNCGLSSVHRIERGVRYVITPERGLLGAKSLDEAMLARAADCLHDRMTETVVDASFDGQALFQPLAGKGCMPRGLLPIGDSICRFDPVYGQGMSVAAQEAVLLRDLLERHAALPDPMAALTAAFLDGVERCIDTPWTAAVLPAFAYPEAVGDRPPGMEEAMRLQRAAFAQAFVDPAAHRLLSEVLHLLKPREALHEIELAAA